MQRLRDTDVFLLPEGGHSRLCRLSDGGTERGPAVSLQAGARVEVSGAGHIVAQPSGGRKKSLRGRRLWRARFDADLRVEVLPGIALPEGIRFRSCIVHGHHLYLDAEMERPLYGDHIRHVDRLLVADLREEELRFHEVQSSSHDIEVPGDVELGNGPEAMEVAGDRLLVLGDCEYHLPEHGQPIPWRSCSIQGAWWHVLLHVQQAVAGERYLFVLFTWAKLPPIRGIGVVDVEKRTLVSSVVFKVRRRGVLAADSCGGGYPVQLAVSGDRVFALFSDGQIASADFAGVLPPSNDDEAPFEVPLVAVPNLLPKDGPPNQVITVPGRDAVLAVNAFGEAAILR